MMKHLISLILILSLAGCATWTQPLSAPVEDINVDITPDSAEEKSKAVAPAPELSVERPDYHIVSKGETLSFIALNYGLNYRELAFWNNLRDPNLIKVGSRLRLFPPVDEPVVAVVESRGAPEFTEVIAPANAVSAVSPEISEVAPESAGSVGVAEEERVAVRRGESTIIGADVGGVPTNIPLVPSKTAPLAVKYIYTEKLLVKLRNSWDNTVSVVQPRRVAIAAPAATAASDRPESLRRRFGVDWSWPSAGTLLKKFSESGKGVDITGALGDAVYASADGKVIYANTGIKSYGLLIIIKHENDYLTAYAHNDKVFVKEGDIVKRGDRIAAFGKTGAERVMLHFEVRKGGKPFDPLQVLPLSANES